MAEIEHRHLRQALDFAVLVAAEGKKRRAPLSIPTDVTRFVGKPRIPGSALGRLRRAIEADDEFRSWLGEYAVPDVVDEIGRLWLARPAGWEERAGVLVDEMQDHVADGESRAALRRAQKRQKAAEDARDRMQQELAAKDVAMASHSHELDLVRADLEKANDELGEVRAELLDTRNEVRHARDREKAAKHRLDEARRERDAARSAQTTASSVRDDVLASRIDAVASIAEIESAVHDAQALANRLQSLLPRVGTSVEDEVTDRPEQRSPLGLPGGVLSSSAEAAEFFVRSDAAVLIDGYNVTKLVWGGRSIEQQRHSLLDAMENLARRHGTDVTVVFDGASIVGAHATRRRFVHVMFSPEGVEADDVIRDEVRRLPTSRPVVVVTNDKAIIRDVRADGANTLPSNALIAIL